MKALDIFCACSLGVMQERGVGGFQILQLEVGTEQTLLFSPVLQPDGVAGRVIHQKLGLPCQAVPQDDVLNHSGRNPISEGHSSDQKPVACRGMLGKASKFCIMYREFKKGGPQVV